MSTRDRIVIASAELFRRHGYAATGLKQIVAEADAPFGSIYHFFPQGKEQLAGETIRQGGRFFLLLLDGFLERDDPLPDILAEFFDGAAETLVATDYADACPIATLALELSSTHDSLRAACNDAFESWLDSLRARLVDEGVAAKRADEVATAVLCALEGAFVLARAGRTTRPLAAAKGMAVAAVSEAIG